VAVLTGRHALITGGGTGIGAAIARALAREGAAISLAGRRPEPLKKVAGELPRAIAVATDVTREADCTAMAAAARAAHGPVDIVVANAGVAASAPFARTSLAEWQRILDVNLTGAFLTAKVALADLTRPGGQEDAIRRMIFIASVAGLGGSAYIAPYCASKHGVIGLMRALAVELAATGVTVNAVCPGYTETPMLEASVANIEAKTGRSREQALAHLMSGNPQGRFVTAEEVAESVLWLCTPAARSINGQAIPLSGGPL
jgi:NAD(P)-dependent dehydrogenase (short-subunit alcohol dehydrogenase family)